jgi:hypothetical protein
MEHERGPDPEPAAWFRNGEGEAKKSISNSTIQQTRHFGRPCWPLAPTLRCRLANRGAGPRAQGPRVKSLAHRLREAEPKAVAAAARIAEVAISRPHVTGAVVPGAAATNPERACRLFPS